MINKKIKKRGNERVYLVILASLILFSLGIFIFGQQGIEYIFGTESYITGGYLVGAESIYSGGIATGDSEFKIFNPNEGSLNLILIIEIVIAISVFGVLIIIARSYRDEIMKKLKRSGSN